MLLYAVLDTNLLSLVLKMFLFVFSQKYGSDNDYAKAFKKQTYFIDLKEGKLKNTNKTPIELIVFK